MSVEAGNKKTIDWNNIFHLALHATWWMLKMLFKLVLVIGSAIITLFIFLFDRDDKESEDDATTIAARRNHGLRGDERNATGNWIHEDPDD